MEGGLEEDSVVDDGNWVLAKVWDFAFGQFVGEGGFVDGFEQARTEGGVDFIGGVDDMAGQGVGCQVGLVSGERVILSSRGNGFHTEGAEVGQRAQRGISRKNTAGLAGHVIVGCAKSAVLLQGFLQVAFFVDPGVLIEAEGSRPLMWLNMRCRYCSAVSGIG